MNKKCSELEPGNIVIFKVDPYREGKKDIYDGNVISVNKSRRTVSVVYLDGYKNMNDDIPYEDMIAVNDEENGEMMKFGSLSGRSILLTADDEFEVDQHVYVNWRDNRDDPMIGVIVSISHIDTKDIYEVLTATNDRFYSTDNDNPYEEDYMTYITPYETHKGFTVDRLLLVLQLLHDAGKGNDPVVIDGVTIQYYSEDNDEISLYGEVK